MCGVTSKLTRVFHNPCVTRSPFSFVLASTHFNESSAVSETGDFCFLFADICSCICFYSHFFFYYTTCGRSIKPFIYDSLSCGARTQKKNGGQYLSGTGTRLTLVGGAIFQVSPFARDGERMNEQRRREKGKPSEADSNMHAPGRKTRPEQ